MAYHGCTWNEIGTLLEVNPRTIERNYRDVINIAQSKFKHDLRRLQLKSAREGKGNCTMLIWLGKQYLSQQESPQMDVKKEQFDKFIEWIDAQTVPSSLPALSK